MTNKGRDILREALRLSTRERAEIAGALLESLEPPPDAAVDRAWREEVRRRLEALDAGTVETVPWEQVREQLYERLSGDSN